MTATPRYIRRLREESRLSIGKDLEALIVKRFGTEPYRRSYTEQDLWEQIRKLVNDHNQEHRDNRLEEEPSRPPAGKGGTP